MSPLLAWAGHTEPLPLGRNRIRITKWADHIPSQFQETQVSLEGEATYPTDQGVGVLGLREQERRGVGLAQPQELTPPREQVNRPLADRRAFQADKEHYSIPGGHSHPLRPGPLPTQTLSSSTLANTLSTGLGCCGCTAPFFPQKSACTGQDCPRPRLHWPLPNLPTVSQGGHAQARFALTHLVGSHLS